MPIFTRAASQHFINIHQQNDSILFQFMLFEFLNIFEVSQKIEDWITDSNKQESEYPASAHFPLYHAIVDLVQNLIGSIMDFSLALPWNGKPGSLANLSYYMHLYLKKQTYVDQETGKLGRGIEKALKQTVKVHEKLVEGDLQCGIEYTTVQDICQDLSKLVRFIDRAAYYLSKNIQKFSRDENVLFFLLRNYQKFSILYSPGFVRSFFEDAFSKLDEAEEFLIKRYVQRGFDHLVPVISQKMRQL